MTDPKHAITIDAANVPVEKQSLTHPLVALAMKNSETMTPESLREMLALQRDWEAGEAKKSYTRSMVKLKSEMPSVIERDKTVAFGTTQYSHTSLARAVDTVSPYLSKHGFSMLWTPSTGNNSVSVTCQITHADGHMESTTISALVDTSGKKNNVQAIGSTITYLQRYTALSLLGIATKDMKDVDDDMDSDSEVNSSRNLQAVALLKISDINLDRACEQIGKGVDDWTAADLRMLWAWMKNMDDESKSETQKPKTTEEPLPSFDSGPTYREIKEKKRTEVIEVSRELWGDDAMPKLSQFLRSMKPNGTTINKASPEEIKWAHSELSSRLDCVNNG